MAGRGEQIDSIKPKLQRCASLFKGCAYRWMQVVTAKLARISALGFDAKPLGRAFAGRAFRALPETDFKQML